MLYQQDDRSYEVAASEAEGRARSKMAEIIERGREKARIATGAR